MNSLIFKSDTGQNINDKAHRREGGRRLIDNKRGKVTT